MDPTERDALEGEIRRRAAEPDPAGAATAAIRGYGPEVLRFLLAFHDEAGASEVFSLVAEGLWRGVGTFDWACTFRAFAFGVARRASLRYRRDQGRRARRQVSLARLPALLEIEEQVRSGTLSFLKTERKNRFAELRDALPADDRALLMLRADQELAWKECARALHEGDAPLGDAQLTREAARLRKRFQLIKARLLDVGRREGLMGGETGDR